MNTPSTNISTNIPNVGLALAALVGICNYVELIDTIFTDVEGVD